MCKMFFIKKRKNFIVLSKLSSFLIILTLNLINNVQNIFANEFSLENQQFRNLEHQNNIDDLFSKQLSLEPYFDPKIEIINNVGNKISLKEFRGKLLILYFFSSWC